MNKTRISVVTPSFNQAQFLGRTIKSVVDQDGDFQIEYIVMDGGSTDGSVKLLEKTERELKGNKRVNFSWVSKKDKGQSDAINQGIKKATGSIVGYLNSDDYYEPGCFKKVIAQFEKNKSGKWLTGYSRIVDVDGKEIQKATFLYKKLWLDRYSHNKLMITNFVCQPSTFWKKEIFDKYGLFDENLHYAMDYDFTLRIARKNRPIIEKSILTNFRIHGESKGGTSFKKQFAEDYSLAKKYSNSTVLRALHKVHNWAIVGIYNIVK